MTKVRTKTTKVEANNMAKDFAYELEFTKIPEEDVARAEKYVRHYAERNNTDPTDYLEMLGLKEYQSAKRRR